MVRHRELNLNTVTHLSTNRARRRLTSLIEIPNALLLWQTIPIGYSALEDPKRCRIFFLCVTVEEEELLVGVIIWTVGVRVRVSMVRVRIRDD